MTARHSPVLPPPCPPTPSANRALRYSPPVPNHAAPVTDRETQDTESPP